MTLAHIVEQWIRKLLLGEIRYDPRQVEARWIVGNPGRFKTIWNGNRKDRPQQAAP